MKTLYMIKPLGWSSPVMRNDFYQQYEAVVPMGYYWVFRRRDDPTDKWGPWRMGWCFDEIYDEGSKEVESPEAGKRMAWHDWLSRITPALEEVGEEET